MNDRIVQDVYENRDVRTANEVDEMARLGRFGEQFIAYGTAIKGKDGKVRYYATADEEKLYAFMQSERLNERYFTPIVSLQKRSQVPSGMEDMIMRATKQALLSQMKNEYEISGYFDLMQPLYERKANNNGYGILCEYRDKIEGNFEDVELQLFAGAVAFAYEAKVLERDSYLELMNWHAMIRRQMEDDPVVEDNIGRTLYGFVAWKDQHRECIFDAKEISVIHQRDKLLLEGALVAPMIHRSYWFRQFGEFKAIKQNHCQWIFAGQDEAYYQMLKKIKAQKGVVYADELQEMKEKLKDIPNALAAVCYYEKLWNKA